MNMGYKIPQEEAEAIAAQAKDCLSAHGPTLHEKFMRNMAIRQYNQTLLTNKLLEELLAQHDGDTSKGCY
jgi:hypothetical protein